MKEFYAGMDVGSSVCEISVEDQDGKEIYRDKINTSERNVIRVVGEAREICKGKLHMTIEEGDMAQWLAGVIRPLVDRFVVCDPKRNMWIARDRNKDDRIDARKLAGLLRGNFLKEVYHPEDQSRAEFKRLVQHYHDITRAQASIKVQIKARFRAYGLIFKSTQPFQAGCEDHYVSKLPTDFSRQLVRHLYDMLESAVETQRRAKNLMIAMSRKFPEVARLREVYGLGPVWACTFVAFIQTPFRFKNKRKLWKFCGLGITERSSNGEPLGYRRLDPEGNHMLKNVSYQIFMRNMKGDTDFRRYFLASLERTKDKTHARLNTQRKIVAVLWGMWKTKEPYRSNGGIRKSKRVRKQYLTER